jgi:hypothetical protein
MAESKTAPRGGSRGTYTLELVGLQPGAARPPLLVQAVDAKGAVLHSETLGDEGTFTLPPDALKNARYVVIGASADDETVADAAAVKFRPREFEAALVDGTLPLAEGVWSRFHFHWTCVSGSVRVCRRRRPWFDELFTAVAGTSLAQQVETRALHASRASKTAVTAGRLSAAVSDILAWPVRCSPVCLGNVTVFRRTCCCWPLVVDDPRITVVIRDLGRLVEKLPAFPPGKFPPPPPPDPFSTPLFQGGALNELTLNARADLEALRSLSGEAAVQYINSRSYLLRHLCTCSRPSRVGSGALLADGTFNVCWREAVRFLQANCHDEYAYVVTQTIGGTTTTIYDGVAAGAWYHAGDSPVLTTYRSDAYSCHDTGTGDGTAFVYLDLIGDTDSHELTTPDSTGWDRVAAPDDQSGLLFPVDVGRGLLRNLGGHIELTYNFSEAMKDASVGAMYYRISITRADDDGAPIGPRVYYGDGVYKNEALAWNKAVITATGVDIVQELLGPNTVNSESYLYKIPYDSDADWTGSTRYHASIDTGDPRISGPGNLNLADKAENHLVTLELFNAAGERLRPLGTPASGQPGTEVAKAFKFRRWFQPEGSPGDDTKEVPYAALTHLFCWDNRAPVADITRLVLGATASNEPCQFLVAAGDAEFAIEYRAYVPDPRFQQDHSIGWVRGLNGTAANGGAGALPTPASPSNVGKPAAPPQNSGSNTFEQMLTSTEPNPTPPPASVTHVLERCAFAVTLTTRAKTPDGGSFTYPHAQETAAFALEIDGTP